MNHLVEIRSYNLKPGTRDEFHRLFLEEAYPLIRRFDSLAQREQSEESFYGSDEWRQGPREAVLACIENYTEFVLEVDEVAVKRLRKHS